MALVRLDEILRLAPRTVDIVVQILRCAGEVGDDEAAVGALWPGLDARQHTAGATGLLSGPGLRGVVDFAVTAHLLAAVGLPVLDPADRDILGQVANLAEQNLVAREAEDVADAGTFAER